QYNIKSMNMIADVFILMVLAILAKGKTWTVTQYAFHTLFPVVTSDLLYRLLGLFFIPLLLNLPVAEVGPNALFYLLSYGLILPLYFVFDRFLGLDLKRWKVYSDDSFHNLQISRRAALAMATYLLGIFLSMNLDSWFLVILQSGIETSDVWVLLSAVAFIFLVAHLNQLSRQYLEESLAMEEKRHLNSLTKANQKIDLLYNELLQYRQSYQTVVEQFSEEVRDQEEALAEQVYQNVLRESAKEFERFRVIDNPKLENIQSLPLRSLLSARMMEAKRSNIPVTCDIPEEISGFTMNVVDLTLLVSIFFSNAIDESKQVPASQINFSFHRHDKDGSYHFVMENRTQEEKVDLDAIMQEENQKKTSGLNLHSAKDILRKYSDANLITSSGDYLFKQELIFK
ncbi:MAG: GHKL domain-containing protein, partial [Streptococcus salivarius]